MNKPFTRPIVVHLRRAHQLPSHADRLRARGLLTINETAAATRRAPQHDQGLAPRRTAHLPQSQRQERATLRPTRPQRPTPHSAPRLAPARPRTHPTIPTRCTMKPTPWPADRPRRGSPIRPPAAHRTQRTLRSGGHRQHGSRPPDPTPASPATPQPPETAARVAHRMSGASLEKISAARDHPRPAHLTGHHPPATPLPMTDRDEPPRLPQVALDQLARPIHRPLKRPRSAQEPRPDLAHVVIEDRLAAHIAQLDRHLPQPLRRDPRISTPALADPVPERIQLRHRRRPLIRRRHLRRQRPPHRLAMQPGPPTDLPDR